MSSQQESQFKAWDPSYPESFFIMGEINGVGGIFTVSEAYIKSIARNDHLINVNLSAFTIATRAIGKASDMTKQEQQNNEENKVGIPNDETVNIGVSNVDDRLHRGGYFNLFSRLCVITMILFSTFVLMATISVSEEVVLSSSVWLKNFLVVLVGVIAAVACIFISREFEGEDHG